MSIYRYTNAHSRNSLDTRPLPWLMTWWCVPGLDTSSRRTSISHLVCCVDDKLAEFAPSETIQDFSNDHHLLITGSKECWKHLAWSVDLSQQSQQICGQRQIITNIVHGRSAHTHHLVFVAPPRYCAATRCIGPSNWIYAVSEIASSASL